MTEMQCPATGCTEVHTSGAEFIRAHPGEPPPDLEVVTQRDPYGTPTETAIAASPEAADHWNERIRKRRSDD